MMKTCLSAVRLSSEGIKQSSCRLGMVEAWAKKTRLDKLKCIYLCSYMQYYGRHMFTFFLQLLIVFSSLLVL